MLFLSNKWKLVNSKLKARKSSGNHV